MIENRWRSGRELWLDAAVAQFLYGGGENPFGQGQCGPNQVNLGQAGVVVRDAFDPAYERPYMDEEDLVRLGYVKDDIPW